jgi:hypothetical protein
MEKDEILLALQASPDVQRCLHKIVGIQTAQSAGAIQSAYLAQRRAINRQCTPPNNALAIENPIRAG